MAEDDVIGAQDWYAFPMILTTGRIGGPA